jgi:ribonucleoside-diphosphate reductase alpha chain
LGYEDVYNITVDDTHNFGIAIPNKENTEVSVIITKNCGETTLGPYGVCDLGSIVLPNFIPEGGTNTNWKKLERVVKLAVRFLDNIIDVNKYVLKEIDINAHKSRRIGLGVIGLADYLFAKKARYGSPKAVQETENLIRRIRDYAYQASIELADEKGAFPMFDPIPYGKASFVRKLPAAMRADIKKHGVRNCTIMALAPTGTISLLTPYMSAIEPLFAKAMLRSDRVSDRMYIHPKYQAILDSGEETPEWFVDSFDLKPSDHFEIQVACQKYCDGSVSKTINLPRGTTAEELSNLLLEYTYDLKGVTVYVDGSRDDQILNQIKDEDVRQYVEEQKIQIEGNMEEGDVTCASGSCDLEG